MNEKITLQDLVNLFSEKQGINKKDAEVFVRTLFELIGWINSLGIEPPTVSSTNS